MATIYRPISLKDTFSNCLDIFMEDAPSFFQLLDEHFGIQEFFDTSCIELFVTENNPKNLNTLKKS